MKFNLLRDNDGSGRELREAQVTAMQWVEPRLKTHKQLILNLPVASGKSLILKSLQRLNPGPIITANNNLTRQYVDTYPDLNLFIGKSHYKCGEFLTTCELKQAALKKTGHDCEACPLNISRNRYKSGHPSVVNPMSLYYANKNNDPIGKMTYTDEAHAAVSLIRLITQDKIKLGPEDKILNLTNELVLIPWLIKKQEDLAKQAIRAVKPENRIKYQDKADKYRIMVENLETNPEVFSLFYEDNNTILNIMPLTIPPRLIRDIFGNKGIFMSGTLFEPDIRELTAGREYEVFHGESPIPVENRRIDLIPPKDTALGYGKCDPEKLVRHLEKIIDEKGKGERVFIHSTYSLSEQMAPFWKRNDVITHTKESKADELKKFLNEGGVMVGSGLSEGIDLKGELCGLNIVTQLNYPNLKDNFVTKRKALGDGQLWYKAETIKHLMQACGRGVRTETDKCVTVVVDDRAPKFILDCSRSKILPKYFLDSLRIGG